MHRSAEDDVIHSLIENNRERASEGLVEEIINRYIFEPSLRYDEDVIIEEISTRNDVGTESCREYGLTAESASQIRPADNPRSANDAFYRSALSMPSGRRATRAREGIRGKECRDGRFISVNVPLNNVAYVDEHGNDREIGQNMGRELEEETATEVDTFNPSDALCDIYLNPMWTPCISLRHLRSICYEIPTFKIQ